MVRNNGLEKWGLRGHLGGDAGEQQRAMQANAGGRNAAVKKWLKETDRRKLLTQSFNAVLYSLRRAKSKNRLRFYNSYLYSRHFATSTIFVATSTASTPNT
jgi:hypothetical protein